MSVLREARDCAKIRIIEVLRNGEESLLGFKQGWLDENN